MYRLHTCKKRRECSQNKKEWQAFFFFFENPEHSQCIMPCKSNGIFVSEIMCTAEEQKVDTVTFDAKIVLPNGVKKPPPSH